MLTHDIVANLFQLNPEFMERKKFRQIGPSIFVDALSYQHRNCLRLGCPCFFAGVDKDFFLPRSKEILLLLWNVSLKYTATFARSTDVCTKTEMHDLHVPLINGDQTKFADEVYVYITCICKKAILIA